MFVCLFLLSSLRVDHASGWELMFTLAAAVLQLDVMLWLIQYKETHDILKNTLMVVRPEGHVGNTSSCPHCSYSKPSQIMSSPGMTSQIRA